jgi:hypothetical protein
MAASVSFGIVSIIAYSLWAFRVISSYALLFPAIAAVYVGLSGFALSRLIAAPELRRPFPLWLALGFLLYATGWCAFWFGLKGKFHADLWGAAVGLAMMTWLLQRALHHRGDFLPVFAVLFACHTFGYTLGDELHVLVRGPAGRLLWGGAHGLGFGAGLGYLIFRAQIGMKKPVTPAASGTSSG